MLSPTLSTILRRHSVGSLGIDAIMQEDKKRAGSVAGVEAYFYSQRCVNLYLCCCAWVMRW